MSYEIKSPGDLLPSCGGGSYNSLAVQAEAWVEAENIFDAYAILIRWFGYMQRGEAALKYPDPKFVPPPGRKPLTQELADQIIAEITEDYDIEYSRFPSESKLGPGFDRLPSHSRIAMAQELYRVLKLEDEINEEAARRLAAGEEIPPKAHLRPLF